MSAKRFLFFSPYARWTYHTLQEITWAHALSLRGHEPHFVLCNGLAGACDVYKECINPRHETSCLECQALVTHTFAAAAMPYEWLGQWLPRSVRPEAEAWVATLAADALLEATWKDRPVGRWAATSAYAQYRTNSLDLSDPGVERMLRALVVGTIAFAEALDALYDELRPDTVVMLNGRFFAHWAAVEVAREHGVEVVTHERGLRKDTCRFHRGGRTHELSLNRTLWDLWQDVPLNRLELKHVAEVLEDRRTGKNYSRLVMSPPAQRREEVRAALGLDQRPVVAVFNSSDDETAAFPDRLAGAFPNPRDFLPAVGALAATRPDLQFVVRIHPNVEKRMSGVNHGALEHAEQVRAAAPPNVTVVMPSDDVSSYTLTELADVGIVHGSTIGLEMAALGKPVLVMARATYSHVGCATQVDHPAELAGALDAALARGPSEETARLALRWSFHYFREFAIPFEQVHERGENDAQLCYSHLTELMPGRHAGLDRVCDWLASDAPTFHAPAPGDDARSTADEDAFLPRWLARTASGTAGAT